MKTDSNTLRRDLPLLLMRLMIGWVFVFHGSQKLFGWFGGYGIEGTAGFFEQIGIPFPVANVILAGSAEFFGGLVLLIGTGTSIAVIPMIVSMLVASFVAHGKAFSVQDGGMEYALTLAVVLTALGLMGPGRFTVGRLLSTTHVETGGALTPQGER